VVSLLGGWRVCEASSVPLLRLSLSFLSLSFVRVASYITLSLGEAEGFVQGTGVHACACACGSGCVRERDAFLVWVLSGCLHRACSVCFSL